MSIRESLNRIPPAVSISVVVLVILVVGIYIYAQLKPTTLPEVVPAEKGEKTTLKCAECGHTFEQETLMLQQRYGLPNGRIELADEALRCPQCKRYSVEIAEGAGK